MRSSQKALVALFLGLGVSLGMGSSALAEEEWEEDTIYYEDDAWYDISEWLDGNDYNPTDESFEDFDDETFQASSNTGSDQDNDWSYYGYDALDKDNDWFYDYYDYGAYSYWDEDDDDLLESGYRYYDYDNDGTYDAFVTFYDWDTDGFYEDYNYYSLNASQKNQQKMKQQTREQVPRQSRQQMVDGQIKNVKRVAANGEKHLVVNVARNNNKQVVVDLGPVKKLQGVNLMQGDQISVRGPISQVGDKKVVLATFFQANNTRHNINRQREQFQGEVASTHKTKIRGQQHLIAMVDTQKKGGKVAVDLGPADKLKAQVKEGSKLTFSAVPVQVKDQRLLMAQTIEQNGKQMKIDRRKQKGEKTNQQS